MLNPRYVPLLMLLLGSSVGLAQSGMTVGERNSRLRSSCLKAGFGCLDLFSIGYGWQVQDDFTVGFKVNTLLIKADVWPTGANGIGVSGSYYFHPTGYDYFFGTNAVTFEASYNGYARGIQVTIGHEAVLGEDWELYWSFGIGCAFQSHRGPNWLPAVQLGISQNF